MSSTHLFILPFNFLQILQPKIQREDSELTKEEHIKSLRIATVMSQLEVNSYLNNAFLSEDKTLSVLILVLSYATINTYLQGVTKRMGTLLQKGMFPSLNG